MNWLARGLVITLAIACGALPARSDSIAIGGVARTFVAQLPKTKPAPLVIVLHDNTLTGIDMVKRTSWPLVTKRDRGGAAMRPPMLFLIRSSRPMIG